MTARQLAIVAEGLGKRYHIDRSRPRYRTLRDAIADAAGRSIHRVRRPGVGASQGDTVLWALADVSFDVEQGTVFGIIGANGSGKTTLLKVLGRITPPTSGRAEIRGRVGCVLEAGTGFHPELTGRENVFLSGIILGMRHREIKRKLDEIVAFADVERFVDTPIKRYSTGMAVRLGFAVAVHLDADILLIDEILAVGDAGFQRRCLQKMHEVAAGGRTVLLVSHNLEAVRALCLRGLWLQAGRVRTVGDMGEVARSYESSECCAKGDPRSMDELSDLERPPRCAR
jgi:lipopolysaccharide transport system ATP-binding protein